MNRHIDAQDQEITCHGEARALDPKASLERAPSHSPTPCDAAQAAHGFTSSSRWAPRVGAFINLESTGPGGPDVVFQHAGDWTIQEYAAAAKYPRGSVVGQVRALALEPRPFPSLP